MSHRKPYMADEKVQNKAMEQAEIVDQKVTETINTVEKSKLGKKFPTEIQSINITDIIKFLLLNGVMNFFPLFLMFSSKYNNKFDYFRKLLNFSFIIVFCFSYLLTLACYVCGTSEIYKFILFVLALKIGLAAVLMIFFAFPSFIGIFIAMLYISYLIVLDSALLYYLGIYMKRLDSDKYDEYGVKITTKMEEKV